MNDSAIAILRSNSLRSVLTAARRRRIRRRAIALFGGGVVLAIIAMLLGPARNPEGRSGHAAHPSIARVPQLDPAPPPVIVRTTTGSLVRVNTSTKPSIIRFKTPRTAAVQRIDTPALAHLFPGNGIAVIHTDPKMSRAVFFLTSTEMRPSPH